MSDDATSSPLVGPDGDVYIGVLEIQRAGHNFRGWLLHFNAALTQARTPGAFGWDNTPSIVPTAMVPQYTGIVELPAAHQVQQLRRRRHAATARTGMAILDPNDQTQADPVIAERHGDEGSHHAARPDARSPRGPPGSVQEWCVNTAAVDPFTRLGAGQQRGRHAVPLAPAEQQLHANASR